ncbi:type IV pilus twitching motility protein PilT [Aminithiophilus ramosus]|uniref:Type IV pilus twitching motility protein PilT n=2 Tax=Synergistales TaxID=649776 RepID=A0A9Q7AD28_9BACT|nr:type IV pilus twitching motility protein PilT [Aminithiophilus ramosus]QTX31264.1 type IV pilus twitching motility protein PilT [Aminithiophilus ramosus]QVL35064.1 type IV pilus twitching motility protein PilT [Synergistota bacterium]
MALTVTVQALLAEVVRRNASDVHFAVGVAPALRIDGQLRQIANLPPLEPGDVDKVLDELLSYNQRQQFREKKEIDFSFSFRGESGLSGRFRGNGYFELGRPALALRLIPDKVRSISQLLLPKTLMNVCQARRGLFLVTGPTGHGKSTTMAALIQEINLTRSCHVVTIEDPVEYLFRSERAIVSQREVGSDTGSFTEALRRVLRQDPDVILIGEMRDLETIGAALTAAETGHLVFATLHTADAPQSVDRIIDVFPSEQQRQIRLQVSSVLIGICSQQLIAVSGGGRIVATELLLANNAIRNCIREGKLGQIKSAMQTGGEAGMHTMEQDLARYVKQGVLSYDDAASYAYDLKDLERLVFEGMV